MLESLKNIDWIAFWAGVGETSVKLLLAGLMAQVLNWGYRYFARDWDEIKPYAKVIIPLAMIMTLLSSIITMSLSVAIGFVGSLAIIRFRLRTQNTEILIFLLFGICIGVASGTGLFLVSILGTISILILLLIYRWLNPQEREVIMQVKCERGFADEIFDWMKKEIGGFSLESMSSKESMEWIRVRLEVPDNAFLTNIYQKIHEISDTAEISIVPEESKQRLKR